MNSRGIFFVAVVFLTGMLMHGCKTDAPEIFPDAEIDRLIDSTRVVCDSSGGLRGLRYLDSCLAGRETSVKGQFRLLAYKHGVYCEILKNPIKTLVYADSMVGLVRGREISMDTSNLFRAYMMKANASYRLEYFDSAFKYYAMARSVALNSKEPCNEFYYLCRIGMAYYREEQFLESAHMFQLAFAKSGFCTLDLFEKYYRQQEALSNTALAYNKAGMTDSALVYYRLALSFIGRKDEEDPKTHKHWGEAASVVYGNLGGMFNQLGLLDSAEFYLTKSIVLNKSVNRNIRDRKFNMLKLADLYCRTHRLDAASEVLAEYSALDAGQDSASVFDNRLEFDIRSTEVYSKYYDALGNYKMALVFSRKHDSLSEVRAAATNKIIRNDLVNGVDNISHEQQISSLEKDFRISQQKNIILFLTIVLALILLGLFISALRKYVRKNRVLQITNDQITVDSEQKEQALRNRLRRDELNFMALIENTDDFLWSVDRNFNLLAFNRSYKEHYHKVFGAWPEIGSPEVIKDQDPETYKKLTEGYVEVLSGRTFNRVEKGLPGNTAMPTLEIRFKPIRNDHEEIVAVSCFRRDITAYVRLVEQLEESNRQLRDVAWVQSHKLRGPLATIMGIADYIASERLDGPEAEAMMKALAEKLDEMDAIIHEIVKRCE